MVVHVFISTNRQEIWCKNFHQSRKKKFKKNLKIFKVFFYLFKTKVVNASPSTSSAMINNGRRLLLAISNAGTISWMLPIFFSLIKTRQFWYSHLLPEKQNFAYIIFQLNFNRLETTKIEKNQMQFSFFYINQPSKTGNKFHQSSQTNFPANNLSVYLWLCSWNMVKCNHGRISCLQ